MPVFRGGPPVDADQRSTLDLGHPDQRSELRMYGKWCRTEIAGYSVENQRGRRTMEQCRKAIEFAGTVLVMLALLADASAIAATPDQAKAFSERASNYILQVGEDKAFADFTRKDGGFIDGELYVFCYDRNGLNKAHGGNPAFVGRNLLHIKDPDGAEPNAMIVKMGFEQGRGWVDFKWPNPVTKRIENKSAYVIRTNETVCGVGYYKG